MEKLSRDRILYYNTIVIMVPNFIVHSVILNRINYLFSPLSIWWCSKHVIKLTAIIITAIDFIQNFVTYLSFKVKSISR
jgi:hypothetical protein